MPLRESENEMTMAKAQVCRIKPITSEMIHSMTLDQRKTLHKNASKRDSPTAQAILALIFDDSALMKTKIETTKLNGDVKKAVKIPARKAKRPSKSNLAVFGRTS